MPSVHPDRTLPPLRCEFLLPEFAQQLPALIDRVQNQPGQLPMSALHAELIAPFREGSPQREATDVVVGRCAAPGSTEAVIADRILTYGYCSHYYTGEGEPQLPAEPDSPAFQRYTLIATYQASSICLVLGTLQAIVGVTVPALSLFVRAQGMTLPHLAATPGNANQPPIGELRRFAVNPLLAAIPALPDDPRQAVLRAYRSIIYKELYELALPLFCTMKVEFVYGITTPELYPFFTRSGMPMSPVAGLVLANNEEVRTLQQQFAHYWRPQAPLAQQPALYRIHLPKQPMVSNGGNSAI